MKKYCVSTMCAEVSSFRNPTPIDDNLLVERVSPNCSCKSVKFVDDVYMLFNQRRLDKLTLAAFTEYVNSLPSSGSDVLKSVRSKMSDSQLFDFVKSRYIQTASELRAWCNYLSAEFDKSNLEAADIVKEQMAADASSSVDASGAASSVSE